MFAERSPDQLWIEPFVGGGNMIDKAPGRRIGYDIDTDVISGLITIRDNIKALPANKSELSEERYKKIKKDKTHLLHGYTAYQLSYGGKKWGGYCRDKDGKRDYIAEGYRNALNQSPKLQGVKLVCKDYRDIYFKENSFIYCDPPYKGTTKYGVPFTVT